MRNRPYGFEIYLVNVKNMRTIAQIFLAFSEKLNLNSSSRNLTIKTQHINLSTYLLCTYFNYKNRGENDKLLPENRYSKVLLLSLENKMKSK